MQMDIDGAKTFFTTGGQPIRPELPTLVLLHGAGLDQSVWSLQSRYLAHRGRNVVVPDLPGHGRSAGAPLRSITEMADWVWRLLDRLGIAQAALAGHSMGTFVALAAAQRAPTRVRALGLVGAASAMPVHPDLLAAAEANTADAITMLTVWSTGVAAGLGGSAAPGLWIAGGARMLWARAAPGVLHADLAACNAFGDALAAAAKIACTAMIVQGSRDAMTPLRGAQSLAAAVRGATLHIVDGAGHLLLAERPAEVLAMLTKL